MNEKAQKGKEPAAKKGSTAASIAATGSSSSATASSSTTATVKEDGRKTRGRKPITSTLNAGEDDGNSRKRKFDMYKDTEEPTTESAIKLNIPFALKKILVDDWEYITTKRYLPTIPVCEPNQRTVVQICDLYLATLRGEDVDLKQSKKPTGTKSGTSTSSSSSSSSNTNENETTTLSSSTNPDGTSTTGTSGKNKAVTEKAYRTAKEVIDGLRHYFDKAFPVFLLYRFERLNFDAWFRERRNAPTSSSSSSSSSTVVRSFSEVCGGEHFLRLFTKLPELLSSTTLSKEEHDILVTELSNFMRFLAKHHKVLFSIDHYWKASDEYCRIYDNAMEKGTPLPRMSYDKIYAGKAGQGITPNDPLCR